MAKHHIVKKEKRYDFWGHLTIPYQYLYGDGKMSAETFANLISNYLKQEYKIEMDIAEGIKLYSIIHHETPRDADGYKSNIMYWLVCIKDFPFAVVNEAYADGKIDAVLSDNSISLHLNKKEMYERFGEKKVITTLIESGHDWNVGNNIILLTIPYNAFEGMCVEI